MTKVLKRKDHYLIKTDKGEYHLSLEEYKKLGKKKAIELAISEIEKKNKSSTYSNETINFKQARDLGFCEYGIKDFCKRLNLNIDKEYTIGYLLSNLDVNTFMKYSDECLKLFGNSVFDKFGGVVTFLDENRRFLDMVIRHGGISDKVLHLFAYHSAMRVIGNFEEIYPNDKRPRVAIEAKLKFINGEITESELAAARLAATEAAAESTAYSAWSRSAAYSAAWSASLAAEAAAELAAWSARSAAYSTAELAARSTARSAELNYQIDTLIELIRKEEATV